MFPLSLHFPVQNVHMLESAKRGRAPVGQILNLQPHSKRAPPRAVLDDSPPRLQLKVDNPLSVQPSPQLKVLTPCKPHFPPAEGTHSPSSPHSVQRAASGPDPWNQNKTDACSADAEHGATSLYKSMLRRRFVLSAAHDTFLCEVGQTCNFQTVLHFRKQVLLCQLSLSHSITYRQTDRQTDTNTHIQTHTHTHTQTHRQTDRQTHTHTHTLVMHLRRCRYVCIFRQDLTSPRTARINDQTQLTSSDDTRQLMQEAHPVVPAPETTEQLILEPQHVLLHVLKQRDVYLQRGILKTTKVRRQCQRNMGLGLCSPPKHTRTQESTQTYPPSARAHTHTHHHHHHHHTTTTTTTLYSPEDRLLKMSHPSCCM